MSTWKATVRLKYDKKCNLWELLSTQKQQHCLHFRRLKLISKKNISKWQRPPFVHTFNFCPQPYFCTILSTLRATVHEVRGLLCYQCTNLLFMCKLRLACCLVFDQVNRSVSDWKNRPENVHLIGLDDVSTYYYK